MEVRINPELIRSEREKRAWSQSHLASVSGLGLRTVQRIEAEGKASYESAAAVAAVFAITVAGLLEPAVGSDDSAESRTQAPMLRIPRAALVGAFAVATVLVLAAVLYSTDRSSAVDGLAMPELPDPVPPDVSRTDDFTGAKASEWATTVTSAVSQLASVTRVEDTGRRLQLEGEATTPRDVSRIMRLLHEERLGTPVVEGIEVRDIGARFVITLYP